jgi:hypothetical protein
MDQPERNRMPEGFPPIKEPRFPYIPNLVVIYVATVAGVLTINEWPVIVQGTRILSGIACNVCEHIWHFVMTM